MAKEQHKKSEQYDRLKEFEGSKYSGMKVGASHRWKYDEGEWRERKVTPDEWEVYYETTKRRSAWAPEGTGAPVGTEYNWLIIAHQRVDKLDANSYRTCLDGKKFKVAHKRASMDAWNIAEKSQRKRVIRFLEQVVSELRQADEYAEVPFTVGEKDRIYGLNHRTRKELYDMAIEQEIPNRSKMSWKELLEAIKGVMDGLSEEKPRKSARSKSRKALVQEAGKQNIRGRSTMKKDELIRALGRRKHRERESTAG